MKPIYFGLFSFSASKLKKLLARVRKLSSPYCCSACLCVCVCVCVWRWAFLRTGNTLIKANCASVRQSRDSLDRDRHNVTKKSRRRRAVKPLELRRWKNARIRVFGTLLCL